MAEHPLRFADDVDTSEDGIFNFCYIYFCQKAVTLDKSLYFYNRFNYSSCTKTYHPKVAYSNMVAFRERRKAFRGGLTREEHLAEEDWLLTCFGFALSDYVYFLPKDEALEKIKESCEIFRPLFADVLDPAEYGEGVMIPDGVAAWPEYKRLIEAEDWEGLYEFSKRLLFVREKEHTHPHIRKILVKLREFQIFTLKLGFKK